MTTETPKKAVIYVRVSSVAQVNKGHGAESQAARCAEFARMKGYQVIKTFEDKAVSGSLVDRPGMKTLLGYLRQHRKENIRVLIDDISRLARGLEAHLALRAAIAQAGGILESPSIEFGEDSDSQLIEHLLASVSAHARVKNAEQTRNRMEARLRQGYWPFISCLGYRYESKEGCGKVLVRDEPFASIIREGLEGYASGRFQTQAEVKRFFESQPEFPRTPKGDVRNQYVHEILTHPLYAGMVERPQWGVSMRKGKHEGLIDFATFEKIQSRLKGRAYAAARPDLNADFPLRGSIACDSCGRSLTACWSRSKTGDRHGYYYCFTKGCSERSKSIRKAEIENAFEQFLGEVRPSGAMLSIVKAMFNDAWEMQRVNAFRSTEALNRGLAKIETEMARLLDRVVTASNDTVIGAYERRIEELEREKLVMVERGAPQSKPTRTFEEMFELAWSFLANPSNLWKSNRLEDKQTVMRLVLADRLRYSRILGLRTPKLSNAFSALEAMKVGNFSMAEREGFTDITYLFVNARENKFLQSQPHTQPHSRQRTVADA